MVIVVFGITTIVKFQVLPFRNPADYSHTDSWMVHNGRDTTRGHAKTPVDMPKCGRHISAPVDVPKRPPDLPKSSWDRKNSKVKHSKSTRGHAKLRPSIYKKRPPDLQVTGRLEAQPELALVVAISSSRLGGAKLQEIKST